MNHERNIQLVLETLHYTGSEGEGCFTVNRPGLKLLAADSSVLDAIENILHAVAKGEHPASSSGLDYVIGSYLVLASKHNSGEIVPLICSLPDWLVKRVLLNIPVFFRKIDDAYNFGTPPAVELIEFVRQLEATAEAPISNIAGEVIAKLVARGTIPSAPRK